MAERKRLLIIIPAYNEAGNIEKVITGLHEEWDYIIANDGSVDDTAKICKENQFNMLDIPINLGLGGYFRQHCSMHMKEAMITQSNLTGMGSIDRST